MSRRPHNWLNIALSWLRLAVPGQYFLFLNDGLLTMWHIRKSDGHHITGADGGSVSSGSVWVHKASLLPEMFGETTHENKKWKQFCGSVFLFPGASFVSVVHFFISYSNYHFKILHGTISHFSCKVFQSFILGIWVVHLVWAAVLYAFESQVQAASVVFQTNHFRKQPIILVFHLHPPPPFPPWQTTHGNHLFFPSFGGRLHFTSRESDDKRAPRAARAAVC